MRTLAISIALLTGCDDGWHEDGPALRASTSWRLLPGIDDSRVAVSLEPRKIHRNDRGGSGYATTIVGPTIAVEHDTPFATFERGTGEVRVGPTRAWLLQTDLTSWEHAPPSSSPPRMPFVHATVVDRSTFAMTPVTLSPPVEFPALVGDVLFDVTAGGFSDVERDIVVRRRDLDGTVVTLHAGRGFASATCARDDGVIVVYQRAGGALEVVAIAGDSSVTEATFPGVRFDPAGMGCNEAATHVAVLVPTGVSLIDIAAGTVAVQGDGMRGPIVISEDGSSFVAVRASDRMLVYADRFGPRELGIVSSDTPETPVVAGDLAMFELQAAAAVVDVKQGKVGTKVPALRDYMYPFEMKRWGDRFVISLSDVPVTTYEHELAQLSIVDFASVTPLPLPAAKWSPGLFLPGDQTLYLRAYDGAEAEAEPHLIAIDLPSASVRRDELLPLCDETAVLEGRGCR